jgi:hypothetical protein
VAKSLTVHISEGHCGKANRDAACARAKPHPQKSNEKNQPKVFAKTLYKSRGRIVQGFGKLKRFKRVALRCDKTERSYRSIVSIAASLYLIKLVDTAEFKTVQVSGGRATRPTNDSVNLRSLSQTFTRSEMKK